MALVQLNFRVPKWQKRRVAQFAEDDGKTLEGFLQDVLNDILDDRLDEIDAEAQILSAFVDHHRTRRKFNTTTQGGQT